jgi:hypothetical protein
VGGRGGRPYACVRGGVIRCAGVSHPVRKPWWVGPASSWRRNWRETARPTHWSRPPHGLGRRSREGKEPLLRLGRGRRRSQRRSGKEARRRGVGAKSRGTRGWPEPHGDGASPRVVEGWPLRATRRAAPAALRATATALATATMTVTPRASRLSISSRGQWGRSAVMRDPPKSGGAVRGAL